VANPPLSLDPHLQDEEASYAALGNIFEALTSFDAEMRLQPGLAVGWESPDDLTWRLHLRPGVRFHDGRALTVDDVVASLERARHHPRSGVAGYLVAIREVHAAGAGTVEIVTSRSYPLLLHKLAFVFVVPAGSPDEIRQPVGTGPYRLLGVAAGKVLQFERFAGYWGPQPPEARVDYLPVDRPAERIRLLQRGEADVVASIPIDDTPAATSGFRFEARPGLSVVHLGLRTDRPPLSDPRVRRAIHLALDRQAVVDRLLGGHAWVASQPLGPQVFGFEPRLPVPRRDLAGARALLAEAGLGDGLALDLEHQTGSSRHVALIREQLAEAGIRVTTVVRSFADLYPRLVKGEVQFYLAGVSCSTGDASDLLDDALHTRDEARGYGGANFMGYSNPRLDELIERSGATLDTAQRRSLLQAAVRLAMEELPLVPLWERPLVYGVRDGTTWTPRRDGRPYGRDMQRVR
jgi:peptide/nickel transport system substrate-binding protein